MTKSERIEKTRLTWRRVKALPQSTQDALGIAVLLAELNAKASEEAKEAS